MFEYSIKRNSLSKSLKLKVVGSKVIVTAPLKTKDEVIQNFVNQNVAWVLKHLTKSQEQEFAFENGSILDWFGLEYTVTIGEYSRIKFLDTKLVLPASSTKPQIIKTLRAASKKQLVLDCTALAQQHGFIVNGISVKDTSSRWGSCSSNGNISLNWRLAFAPSYVKDYVIIHELCHLRHMNHSQDFWNEVKRNFPKLNSARLWLKNYGGNLSMY